ncbi:MAG: YhdP family protein [Woeseiaceae bacterium]|nr:YhdP family protein [Woeseiaceae bacterium]
MKRFLQKLIKFVAYVGAALVIVLALAVGVFRLMLPRLPEYQEEIKSWASNAIGMQVEFSAMNARWRFSGPELNFFDAELKGAGAGTSLLSAEEVSIGVGVLRLLADRELVVDRILIRDTDIDLRQDQNGAWMIQGLPLDEVLGSRDVEVDPGVVVELVGQDIRVQYEHPGTGQLLPFTVASMSVTSNDGLVEIDAVLTLPPAFGDRLEITAQQLPASSASPLWRLFIEGDSLELTGWSRLQPIGLPEVRSGTADLSLWADYTPGEIQRATLNISIDDLSPGSDPVTSPFGLRGSIEYSAEPNGYLLAANQFRLLTADGDWPQSSLQLRVSADENRALQGLRANASYLNLNHLKYVDDWIPETQRAMLADIDPTGELRDLSIDLSDLNGEAPEFDVTAEMQFAGFAVGPERPGIRNFSGSIRADRDGGRIELASTDLTVDTGDLLVEPITFDDAVGTVIWRRSNNGVIFLSDNIRVRNADFDSESSLQIVVPASGDAPFVDFQSDWNLHDVSAIRRYIPNSILGAPIGQWLLMAPVSGIVSEGTLRLNGSLDRFPFDDGDGSFYVSANFEDFVLRYSERWPAPEFSHVNVVVDNMRLSSTRNVADVLGTSVENAEIVIADLRNPVVEIKAFGAGTLDSLRRFAAASPINEILGGQVDRVGVSGDASLDLTVSYPVRDKLNYDFLARIRASDGTLRVDGFAPPITELNGVVAVSRDAITAESLFGRFLGSPLDLELARVADPQARHAILLDATGSATAQALVEEMGLAVSGVASGNMDFDAQVRFPNTQVESPGQLQIVVESDLEGFGLALPAPFDIGVADGLPLMMSIDFPGEDLIESTGALEDDVKWNARFVKNSAGWDFDRGSLALGGDYPQIPDSRGLHIVGQTPEVRVHDWLSQALRDQERIGMGDRVRTIDLIVDRLYVVGQRFTDHRLRVDRGGSDWVIQIAGAEAQGTVTVPYNFAGNRPLTVDMERLILPGSDDDPAASAISVDPRTLPDIKVNAGEFALGDRFFGELSMDLMRTASGLESENLATFDDSFTVVGRAGWVVDIYEESGQRTYLNASLKSTDIKKTTQRLAYQPGITGNELDVQLDISWAGGPRQDFMESLNGTVRAQLGSGQLEDVEPGAGRVFGLMSIVALPRRLSLDFRDVFDTGFGFDSITASFRLVDGQAYTCDLTLTGPAADVGIVGRAGLHDRDYNQTAIVSANFGNTLPVAGYVLSGPQVAAALFLFSQIFKKPLQEMSQVYYAIDGSWDDPVIEVTDAERFTRDGSLAGCIQETE